VLISVIPVLSKFSSLKSRRDRAKAAIEQELLLPVISKKRKLLSERQEAHIKLNQTRASAQEDEEVNTSIYGEKLDLIDRLIVVTLESNQIGVVLSDEDLLGHIMTFAFAGHETSTTCLAWTVRIQSFVFGNHCYILTCHSSFTSFVEHLMS